MRVRDPIFVGFALALVLFAAARAAEVEMDITPRVLRLGESAICRIVVKGAVNAPQPRLPPLQGFEVAAAGTEQNIQIVNGRQTVFTAYRFQLTPVAAGDFLIGPFRYDLGDRVVDIPAIQVQVLPMQGAGGEAVQSLDELLFATLTTSRPKAYVGETFDITINLYTQPGLNLDRNVSLLDFDTTGLTLSNFEELAGGREAVAGRVYDVRRFRARATALTSGAFTLQPRLRVNIIVQRQRSPRDPFFGDSFFDSFAFFGRVETRAHTLDVRPLELRVHELPAEGRPSNFSGAVGRYSFEVSASPLQLAVGEPITLRYRIQGRGNIDTVRAPAPTWPDGFRAFDIQLVDQNAESGLKVFEQVVIPRAASVTELPAVAFSWFDPEAERYETAVRGPFPLELAAGASGTILQGMDARPAAERGPLGADLVYLKPTPKRPRAAPALEIPPALHGVPALALLLAAVYARRRARLLRDPIYAARLRAPRGAREGLARARSLLEKSPAEAANALADTLARFFGPLLGLPPGQVDADSVCGRLQKAGLDAPALNDVRAMFDFCERMRYAGPTALSSDADRVQLARHLERAPELLRICRRLAT
jgi:hypothetical protein